MGVRAEGWQGEKPSNTKSAPPHGRSCGQEPRRTGQSPQQMFLFQTQKFFIERRKCTLQSMQDWKRERIYQKTSSYASQLGFIQVWRPTRGEAGRRRGGHTRGLKRHSTVSGKFMSLWFLLYPFHTPSLGIIEENTDEKSAKIRLA